MGHFLLLLLERFLITSFAEVIEMELSFFALMVSKMVYVLFSCRFPGMSVGSWNVWRSL